MKDKRMMKKFIFLILIFLGFSLLAYAESNKVKFIGTSKCTEDVNIEEGSRVMKLCDGTTKVIVSIDGIKPGEKMPREVAQEVAGLMWEKYHEMNQKKTQGEILLAHGKPHTKREMMIWDTELDRMIEKGYKLFHSSEIGTNGISCDMCHPNASNTHPETYPKFQTQLKKVVLLRDMINWCIENPLEGKKLADDDESMKAIEAYIMSARKGKMMEYGKH
jgi:thiosulfate dehydrogenase